MQDDCTPLLFAAQNGHASVVVLLLERGAKKEAKTRVRFCGLRRVHVMLRRHADALHLASPRRVQLNKTPLYIAAENGHAAVVKLLLESGANKEAKDLVRTLGGSLASVMASTLLTPAAARATSAVRWNRAHGSRTQTPHGVRLAAGAAWRQRALKIPGATPARSSRCALMCATAAANTCVAPTASAAPLARTQLNYTALHFAASGGGDLAPLQY